MALKIKRLVRGALMIADLKPYPEYKESGAWLGQVPEHWACPPYAARSITK